MAVIRLSSHQPDLPFYKSGGLCQRSRVPISLEASLKIGEVAKLQLGGFVHRITRAKLEDAVRPREQLLLPVRRGDGDVAEALEATRADLERQVLVMREDPIPLNPGVEKITPGGAVVRLDLPLYGQPRLLKKAVERLLREIGLSRMFRAGSGSISTYIFLREDPVEVFVPIHGSKNKTWRVYLTAEEAECAIRAGEALIPLRSVR